MTEFDIFKNRYKNYHSCGLPFIPYELSYASDCPRCNPSSSQWEVACKSDYDAHRTLHWNGVWVIGK